MTPHDDTRNADREIDSGPLLMRTLPASDRFTRMHVHLQPANSAAGQKVATNANNATGRAAFRRHERLQRQGRLAAATFQRDHCDTCGHRGTPTARTMSEKCFALEKGADLAPFPPQSTFLTPKRRTHRTYGAYRAFAGRATSKTPRRSAMSRGKSYTSSHSDTRCIWGRWCDRQIAETPRH